ncbi:hypothetical protein [Erwinia billingiae]|jgi:hypothetical protein|uniref:hypothetical protein n=1 Tax=Erwinia billingiae TaxID=182337 RepID=UPI000D094DC2|nr:hypothetical protein [Erwinia billingiae]PRB57052.1 hypothetical protein CQ001_18775 [Erwinia billingiae]
MAKWQYDCVLIFDISKSGFMTSITPAYYVVGPRQGDFFGSGRELIDAYRNAYSKLDDIKVDARSPNGTHILGENVTPLKAVYIIEEWLFKKD